MKVVLNIICHTCGEIKNTDCVCKLKYRFAKCTYFKSRCKKIVPSILSIDGKLAFFEYLGPDSEARQLKRCKNCGYDKCTHNVTELHGRPYIDKCGNYKPHGPFNFDSYYCGCHGWD